MPSSFLYIGLQRATSKVFDTWDYVNANGNIAAPAGWFSSGFNDSSWPTSATPVVTGSPFGRVSPGRASYVGTAGYPPDTQPLSAWTVPPHTFAGFLIRAHFTLPVAPWRFYMLEWFWTNTFGAGGGFSSLGSDTSATPVGAGVWINGQPAVHWSMVEQLLVPGDNVVAFSPAHAPAPLLAGSINWNGDGGVDTSVSQGGSMSLRFTFSQGIDTGGQANAWGTVTPGINDLGVLGTGENATYLTPTLCDPALPPNVLKIVTNGKTTLFLCADNTVWACGDNTTGLLGIGATDGTVHSTPRQIIPKGDGTGGFLIPMADPRDQPMPVTPCVVDISIGNDCAYALTRDGQVYAWGPNVHGTCGFGIGTTIAFPTPLREPPSGLFTGRSFTAISCGDNFAGVLGFDGQLFTIGQNDNGQCAHSTSGGDAGWGNATYPFPVNGTTFVFGNGIQFECGERRLIVGRDNSGATDWYAAGDSTAGSMLLPATSTVNPLLAFVRSELLADVQFMQNGQMTFYLQLHVGFGGGVFKNVIFVIGDGRPYGGAGDGFGDRPYGLGDFSGFGIGNVKARLAPTVVFDALKLAEAHSSHNPYIGDANSQTMMAAIGTADSLLYTWGYGGYGQMGNGGVTATNLLPIAQNGMTSVIAATVANQIAFAVGAGGTPLRRGRNSRAQIIGD